MKKLLLISSLLAAGTLGAWAANVTPTYDTTTSSYDGTTYAGTIFKISPTGSTTGISSAPAPSYSTDGTTWTTTTWKTKVAIGENSSTQTAWYYFVGDGNNMSTLASSLYSGHTLYFDTTGLTADSTTYWDFAPMLLAGLIVEATSDTVTTNNNTLSFGRDSAAGIQLYGGNTAGFTATVNGNFTFHTNDSGSTTVSGTHTWNVGTGYALTFDSPTTISEGATVSINGGTDVTGTTAFLYTLTNEGAITLNAGTLNLAGGMTGGSLTTAAGTTLALSGKITDATSVTIDAGTTINISSAIFAVSTGTNFIDAESVTISGGSLSADNLRIGGQSIRSGATATFSTDNNGLAVSLAGTETLTWKSSVMSGTWDYSTENWTNSSNTDDQFYQGDSVVFNSTASVTLAKNVVVSGLTVASGATVTITGTGSEVLGLAASEASIAGTLNLASLKLSGAGTIDLGTTGTFTSVTFDNWTGTVKISGRGSGSGTASAFFLNNYGTTGSTIEISDFYGYFGENNSTVNANLVLTNGTNGYAIRHNNGSSSVTMTFAGSISGSGTFQADKNPRGGDVTQSFKFTGDLSDFTGKFESINSLTAGNLTFGAGTETADDEITLGNFTIAWNAASGKTLQFNYGAASTEFSGTISGTTPLQKSGTGTLTLSGTNSYSGATTVSAGTLKITNESALGTSAATIASGANLTVALDSTATDWTTVSNSISGAGTLEIASGKVQLTNLGSVAGAIAIDSGASLDIANASALTLSGAISGAGELTKTGAGTLTLTGSNTLTGAITVSEGTLDLTGATFAERAEAVMTIDGSTSKVVVSSLARDANGNGQIATYYTSKTLVLKNGGTLELTTAENGTSDEGAMRGFTVSAGTGTFLYSGTGDSYLISHNSSESSCRVVVGTDATLDFNVSNADANLIVSKVIEGAGNLHKTGAGTLTLANANTYTVGTHIDAGTLRVENQNALGTGSVSVADNATLMIAVDGGLKASGTVIFAENAKFAIDLSKYTMTAAEGDSIALTIISAVAIDISMLGGTAVTSDNIGDYFDAENSVLGSYTNDLYDYLWNYSSGTLTLTLTAIPEPSMFGLLAGTLALALAGTRRRRRGNAK